MPEDATLDAFVSTGSDGDGDAGAGASEEPTDDSPEESSDDEGVEIDDVDPAHATYAWSSEGGECADCGASVERRWRAEGQTEGELVCPDCKEW